MIFFELDCGNKEVNWHFPLHLAATELMLWKTHKTHWYRCLFLIADDRRNLRHTTDFLLQLGGCLSYRLHRNHNMTDNRFLYAFLLITLSTMCVLIPKLIFHFPIRFPPRLGHSMMITHFRVEYWKRVYRVSVASGLYKQQHNFWPVYKQLPFFCLPCRSLSFLQIYESHTKERWRDQIVPPLD